MNEQILLYIIEIALILVGIAGCILPGLPGVPLVFAGILVQHFFDPNVKYPIWLLIIMFLFVVIVMVLQYTMPAISTKKFGASKYAVRGSLIGLFVGLFLPGIGFLLGPFAGAVLGELFFANKEILASLKAGVGAVIGLLASTVFELVCSISLAILFIYFSFQ